jgi:hypothetical protein
VNIRHSGRAAAQVIRNPFSNGFKTKMDSGLRQNDGTAVFVIPDARQRK